MRLNITILFALALPLAALADTHYVWQQSPLPMPPYTSWATAATNIQDAVDESSDGDTVFVSGGVYAAGQRTVPGDGPFRVVVDKAITLRGIMGPEVTVVGGGGAVGCLHLGGNACTVSGFTITNGFAISAGGGVMCLNTAPVVTNCIITGNIASSRGGGSHGGTLNNCMLSGNSSDSNGGGAYVATLNNCILTGNSAVNSGGGAGNCTLNNCTLTGNSASFGGGAYVATLNNCIVYFNTASSSTDNCYQGPGSLNHCCTTPLPSGGTGNITNVPLFMDTNGWADLRLQSNSPCINAGNNAYVTTTNDLDGNSRVQGGTVDMGAYEYQSPSSVISYAWLQQYGLPTDGSADFTDSDSDSHTVWQEWKAWTIPTNGLSVLKMLPPDPETNGTAVAWQSVSSHSYTLERAVNSANAFSVLQSNIVGQSGTTVFTDTTAKNGDAFFYRVGVAE